MPHKEEDTIIQALCNIEKKIQLGKISLTNKPPPSQKQKQK